MKTIVELETVSRSVTVHANRVAALFADATTGVPFAEDELHVTMSRLRGELHELCEVASVNPACTHKLVQIDTTFRGMLELVDDLHDARPAMVCRMNDRVGSLTRIVAGDLYRLVYEASSELVAA